MVNFEPPELFVETDLPDLTFSMASSGGEPLTPTDCQAVSSPLTPIHRAHRLMATVPPEPVGC